MPRNFLQVHVTHCHTLLPKKISNVCWNRSKWMEPLLYYVYKYIYIYTWLYIYIYICDMPHEMRMKCVLKFSKLCCMHGCIVLLLSAIAPCLFKFAKLPLSRPLRTYYEPTTNLLRTEPLKIILRTSYGLAMSCWHRTSWSDGLVATLRMASNRTARLLYKQRSGQEQCQNNRNWRRKRNCAKDDLRIWKGFWRVLLMFFTYFQLFLHVPTHPQWPSKVPNLVKHNLHRMLRFIAEWMERAIWSRKWTSGMGAVQTPGAGVRRGHGRFAFDLCVSNWHI